MKLTNEQDKRNYRNVCILAEFSEPGMFHSASFELLGAARGLADDLNCEVWAIALGSDLSQTSELISYGADKVIAVEDARLKDFNDELECSILERLVRKYRPEIMLGAATIKGRALIPRLASKLYTGLTADCTELSIDSETGELLQTRPAFGGNIMATIRSGGFRPQMATVRPKVMKALPRDPERSSKPVTSVKIPFSTFAETSPLVTFKIFPSELVKLSESFTVPFFKVELLEVAEISSALSAL